jgi:hypothetical protein
VLHREDWTETRIVPIETAIGEDGETVVVRADTVAVEHKAGDWITDSEGVPYFDVTSAIGLGYGAIRQIADQLDDIRAEIAGDFGGVPLGAVVVLLVAAVAALEVQVLALKKRVDQLEADKESV